MSNEPLWDPPKVGGDVLAYCTRCKMELAHVVISMVSGRPARVICKTCKSQHNYKRAPGSELLRRPGSPLKPRKAPQKTYVKVSEMWEQKMAETKGKPVKAYNVQEQYTKGDVIQHPSFGMGLVEDFRGNGKMTVLFRNEEKVLICGVGAVPGKSP